MPLRPDVERRGETVIVTAAVDLDIASAEGFVATALSGIPNDALAVIVDLTAARYVDSAGIRALFTLAEALARRQQALHLVIPQTAPLRRIVDVVQLETVARLFEQLDEAVDAVEVATAAD